MKYLEIAKLCQFIQFEVAFGRIDRMNNPEEADSLLKESKDNLSEYDVGPALVEMHENFTKYWNSERMIDQLQKDYKKYLLIIHDYINYNAETTAIVRNKYHKIEAHLKDPTFLWPHLIHHLMSEEEIEEDRRKGERTPIWFKVGLKFATGKLDMNSLQKTSAPKLRKELNLPSSADVYIKATINNYTTNNVDKNIYSNRDKMEAISEYCGFNRISTTEDFAQRLNHLKDLDK